jgi:hypothetical protein
MDDVDVGLCAVLGHEVGQLDEEPSHQRQRRCRALLMQSLHVVEQSQTHLWSVRTHKG